MVDAGVSLLHASHIGDWDSLTIRAVAQAAGVNERTVYRHFGNERGLRDAVMQSLEDQAGIVLEGMRLEDVPKMAMRIFEQVSTFPLKRQPRLDPTLSDASRRQHAALLNAVASRTEHWSDHDRAMAAGMLDVLWSVAAYERLVRDWQLSHDEAIQSINWVIDMVEAAIRAGGSPTDRR
jgi:AcrR family transcriptional regulator